MSNTKKKIKLLHIMYQKFNKAKKKKKKKNKKRHSYFLLIYLFIYYYYYIFELTSMFL